MQRNPDFKNVKKFIDGFKVILEKQENLNFVDFNKYIPLFFNSIPKHVQKLSNIG
jgi:hypothetical protein